MRRDLDSLVTQMHSTGIRYEDAVKEFKRQYLREVLAANKGNQCKAAEELGIHRNTLSRTMAELGISLAEIRAGLKASTTQRTSSIWRPHARAFARAKRTTSEMSSHLASSGRSGFKPRRPGHIGRGLHLLWNCGRETPYWNADHPKEPRSADSNRERFCVG